MVDTDPPQLNLDILLSVAEKLLFSPDNDFRLDLREPNADVVNFMFAGPICRWAFFTQFRRLTKLSVNLTEIHLSCPTPIQGIRGILANNKEFFQGPFVISDKFFYVLFCQGLLQPKTVDSFFTFGPKSSDSTDTTISRKANGKVKKEKDLATESPAESLVRLFFFKDSPEKLSNMTAADFSYCNLELDFVKIQDDARAIFRKLGRILNLNAERYLLEISSEFENCASKIIFPKISANRTRAMSISYIVDIIDTEHATQGDMPFDKFYSFLRYIAKCCSNLETMSVHFLLQGEFSDEDFKVLSSWLVDTLEGFRTGKLPAMGLKCDLRINFRAFFPESTLMEANKTDHKLAKMGEAKILDGSDEMDSSDTYTIARKIQLQEKPLICVDYSLVGIEDESSNNDWDGYHGMLPAHPAPGNAMLMAPFDFQAFRSDDSD